MYKRLQEVCPTGGHGSAGHEGTLGSPRVGLSSRALNRPRQPRGEHPANPARVYALICSLVRHHRQVHAAAVHAHHHLDCFIVRYVLHSFRRSHNWNLAAAADVQDRRRSRPFLLSHSG